MKKTHLLLFLLISYFGFAQKAPQSPSMSEESADKEIKVTYGQPSKRGREIFGKLVPYGEVWRTGANAATEITFKKDVNFGGAAVKAGTYSLFTIPGASEWSVILNSELKQWGAYEYAKIKGHNVAEVKVNATTLPDAIEKLTINAENNALVISWDKTSVKVPIK